MTPRPKDTRFPDVAVDMTKWPFYDNRSVELDATETHPFIVSRTPDAAKAVPVAWTINSQGVILNAQFQSAHPADAARIGRFIAEHNGAMAELRINSRLGDLK